MKSVKLRIFIPILCVVILSSCSQLLFTNLDVLRPAKIAFAPEAKHLLIVNNTIIQSDKVGHTTNLLNEPPRKVSLSSDSVALFCISALSEDISDKNFFNSVKLHTTSINNSEDFNSIQPVSSDSINKLCQLYNTDAVLSLDKIKVDDELNEYFLNETNTYLGTLEFKFETVWSIHYLNKPEMSSVQFKDTVFWETESYLRRKTISELPKRADALVDGALSVGHKSANRFVPYWEKVDRYFFDNRNKLMKIAMDSVYSRKWEAAIKYWQQAFDKSKNNRTKAEAANNLAIGYEITGNLDKAIENAVVSYTLFEKLYFNNPESLYRLHDYITELSQRKADLSKLKIQLGE